MIFATAFTLSLLSFQPKTAYGTINIAINKPMTSGSVLCGNASSTLLVGTSTSGRNLMYISNASPLSVFLGLGKDITATTTGVLLPASTTMRFDSTGSFAGAIYCEGNGGTATTTFSDSTQ